MGRGERSQKGKGGEGRGGQKEGERGEENRKKKETESKTQIFYSHVPIDLKIKF